MEQFHEANEELDIEINTDNGQTTYRVNGREYTSIDDLPPEVRDMVLNIQNMYVDGRPSVDTIYEINDEVYENLDDVPLESRELIARLESGETPADGVHKVKVVRNYYKVNGKEYGSFEDIPPDIQEQVSRLLKSGKGKTAEYITTDGVTRKFINGKEVPMRPGEQASGDSRERYGAAHLGGQQASLYHKIRASRPETPGTVSEIDSLSEASLLAGESRRANIILIGRLITTAAYLALIIWSLYQPAGFSSYFYLGFLIGDIATWLIFSVWGWQKSMVEFSFKDLAIHAGGLLFFILLNTREGSFVVARDLRNEAIAILIMVAVVSGAAKWVARFFGLIRRVTEGF